MRSGKICVLGGGNGAYAMAADLALKGFEVNMCEAPEFKDNFALTMDSRKIELIDIWDNKKTAKLSMATTDFGAAMKDVSYIMIAIPAIGHKSFFEHIAPHLEDGQTLVMWPGNFSALLFAHILKEKAIDKDITFVESHTLPWGCRLLGPGRVKIAVEAWKLLIAAFPARHTEKVVADLKDIYPVIPGENVLATSFNNLNPIVHPAGCLLNAGWIDTIGKEFYFYRHGTTLSIARVIKAVYEEVAKIGKEINVSMLEYPDESFFSKSQIMSVYFKASFDKEGAVANISGPSSMKDRYITEDVPYGLVTIAHIAREFQIETPVIDAIIELASVINETDYLREGRSLESLGIAGLKKEALLYLLQEGYY
jgi:opine dehydrogenase